MARGQDETVTGYDCECLIDDVSVKQGTMPPSGGQAQWQIDASALPLGLHHVQTRIVQHRSSGVAVTAVYDALCFRIAASSSHQVKATCHIDGVKVKSSTLTTDGATKTWRIDLSDLPEGLHSVKVTITDKDPDGVARTSVYDAMCYRTSTSSHHEVTATCYVDGDMKKTSTINADGEPVSWILDLSDLPEGVHQVRVDIADKNHEGIVTTSTYEGTCYRAAPGEGHNVTATCYVDEQLVKTQEIIPDGNTQNWMLDLGELPVGLHRVRVDVADKNNEGMVATARYDAMCYRTSSGATHNVKAKCYVDGQLVKTKTVQTNGAANAWTLDLATMKRGMHHVRVSINDKDGYGITTSTTFDAMCYRGIGRVTGYEYWINNDNSIHNKVELSEPQLEYTLISLLPIPKQNIRSKKFHFEINDGQPMLYARNDIRVRFNTEDGSYTEVNGDFVDYRVSQSIDAEYLTSGDHKTIDRPNDNDIKWFKFNAAKGDSLSFKTDRACTLQLFSPSGKELYSVNGADVVKWGGVSGDNDGTYYVALHDVTATQSNQVTIDYLHIDRYAILAQDVKRVGNGGYSTITFDGNGFNELNDVELVCGSNTIHAAEIGHEHNGTTTVTFDFDGAALGDYKAIFTFEEGSVTKNNCVTVESAIEPEIEITAQYSNSYLRGTSTPIKFMVHNKGNMTAYNVPLEIYVFGQDSVSLRRVKIDGYDMLTEFKAELGEDYTTDIENMVLAQQQQGKGDLYAFWRFKGTNYVPSYPYMYWTDFYYSIPPNATKTFVVNIQSQNSNHVMMGVPDEETEQSNPSLKKSEKGSVWHHIFGRQSPRDKCLIQRYGRDPRLFNDIEFLRQLDGYEQCLGPDDDYEDTKPEPYTPVDPNEIYGYLAESGSHAIGEGVNEVNYRIEFENDTTLATASAQNIWVADTLDASRFDLSTFAPMSIKIGNRTEVLDGSPSFIRTIDMRPEIYAIAQVECNYDATTGIAQWHLSSLDPMTMEPVTEVHQGILPVNYDGVSGVGEVSFNINLRDNLSEGTTISNRAGIVFDYNEVIMTPSWVNVIDLTAPASHVTGCELVNDSTAAVTIEASDNLSGPWRYDVMVQYGEGSDWFTAARAVPADSIALVRVYEGIDHSFCAVLTDSAGNVENKSLEPEISFDYFDSSTNSELTLTLAKNWNWMSHNLNAPLEVTALQPNAYRIVGQEGETIKDPSYGYTGTISTLDPTKLYKVQMNSAANVPLQGKLYNAAFKSTDLSTGWNWLGYPLAGALAPSVALANLEAQEGDCLIGQEGMAMFSNGQWSGTLSQLTPGKGYMLKLQGNATLHWNAPRVSTRQYAPGIKSNGDAAPYSVDAYLYPNVMGIVADLYDSGSPVDPDDYWLVAFCGDECRGVAQTVDGHLMMNIYGNSGETVTFKVIDRTTQAVDDVAESRVFAQDVEGTLQTPLVLNIGTSGMNNLTVKGLRVYPTLTKGDVNVTTSYGDIESVEVLNAKGQTVMSLQNMGGSAVISLSDLPDGIYMIRVTTDNGTSTTKVVKQK